MYDTKKYKAPAREHDADNISSSTILCSYDDFITWYDNLWDEEQWKVDDIADTNGIPFYEEASDGELAWLQDVATIEIHASAATEEDHMDHNKFVKLLKDKFDFSLEAANIVAQWYENENALDDFDSIQSLLEYIEDDIYDMLDAATDGEEYEIVSKYIYDNED